MFISLAKMPIEIKVIKTPRQNLQGSGLTNIWKDIIIVSKIILNRE